MINFRATKVNYRLEMETTNNVKLAVQKVGSQAKVADLMGVSLVSLSKWCSKNEVPWNKLVVFCNLTKAHPRLVNPVAAELFKKWK